MHRPIVPPTIHPPLSAYSHGVEVPAGQRLVFCSAQVGMTSDGAIPVTAYDQAVVCFDNIEAILAEVGLGLGQVVRLNAYVSAREHMKPYIDVRNARFATPLPAETLLIVAGFARPDCLVEVEAIAMGPASEARSARAAMR